jgi:hypothetical protein
MKKTGSKILGIAAAIAVIIYWGNSIFNKVGFSKLPTLRCTVQEAGNPFTVYLRLNKYPSKKNKIKRTPGKTYFSLDDVTKNTYIVNNWITEKENGRKYSQKIKYVIDRNTGKTVLTVSPRMWYDTNQTAAVLFETAASTIASCVEK